MKHLKQTGAVGKRQPELLPMWWEDSELEITRNKKLREIEKVSHKLTSGVEETDTLQWPQKFFFFCKKNYLVWCVSFFLKKL